MLSLLRTVSYLLFVAAPPRAARHIRTALAPCAATSHYRTMPPLHAWVGTLSVSARYALNPVLPPPTLHAAYACRDTRCLRARDETRQTPPLHRLHARMIALPARPRTHTNYLPTLRERFAIDVLYSPARFTFLTSPDAPLIFLRCLPYRMFSLCTKSVSSCLLVRFAPPSISPGVAADTFRLDNA